jgi:CRISPR/Cas system-associated exonuclease Cas4 (RecB family)
MAKAARKRGVPKEKKPEPVYDISWLIDPKEAGLDDVLKLFSAKNRYDRGDSELSVTQLINSPQQVALEKQNAEAVKIDEDSESVFALMGKAVHKILEEASPSDSLVEERFFTIVDGVKISGSIDRVRKLPDGTYELIDYKLSSMWGLKDGPKSSWEWQLNMYAYLLEKIYKIKVSKLTIVAMLRDFSQARATVYAPRPIVFVRIPLWKYAAREAFVERRVRLHKQAKQDLEHNRLPARCTPEETWDTDRAKEWWMKNASRGDVYYMDQPRKCAVYCPVKKWCAQYMQYDLGTTFATEILGETPPDNPPKGEI